MQLGNLPIVAGSISKQKIGVLAIQGAYLKHYNMFKALGCAPILVKTAHELTLIDKLTIPGGESTAMRILLKKHNLWDSLKDFCHNKPVFGTCAGAILLAQKIDDGIEESLEIMNIDIARNSYGRQIDSFITEIDFPYHGQINKFPANFIRAPQIKSVATTVKTLISLNETPILVQENNALACAFHPELGDNDLIHRYFLEL